MASRSGYIVNSVIPPLFFCFSSLLSCIPFSIKIKISLFCCSGFIKCLYLSACYSFFCLWGKLCRYFYLWQINCSSTHFLFFQIFVTLSIPSNPIQHHNIVSVTTGAWVWVIVQYMVIKRHTSHPINPHTRLLDIPV